MSKQNLLRGALLAAVALSTCQAAGAQPAPARPRLPSAETLQKAASDAIGNMAWESIQVSEATVEGGQLKWLATTRSVIFRCGAEPNGDNPHCDREKVLGQAPAAAPAPAAPRAPPVFSAATAPLSRNTVTVGIADRGYLYYVSSKYNATGYNFVVYALHDNGQTAEEFARQSGWLKVAEDNGFVVVFPEAANKTWAPVSGGEDAYLKAVYDNASTHMTVAGGPGGPGGPGGAGRGGPPGGEGAGAAGPGRGGPPAGEGGGRGGPGGAGRAPRAQTWQPFNYLTGAGAGAIAAQEFAINNPGIYAAIATLDGMAYDAALARGDEPAQGYLMNQRGGKNAKPVWKQLKKQAPVATWLFTSGPPSPAEAKLTDYWKRANGVAAAAQSQAVDGFQTAVYRNPAQTAQEVRTTVLPAGAKYDEAMAEAIWNGFFKHLARWTSAANGELRPMLTEAEVNKAFDVRTVMVEGTSYKVYVKTPSTYKKGQPLPLVISAHGAMYPAWMYLSQIRMHDVGEKEGFITAYIQGQQNRWDFTRADGLDAKFVEKVIADVDGAYGVDRTRVYMQGFSFGSGLTYMMGIAHPQLFAAVSPNSGIGPMSPEILASIAALKAKGDVRIPMMVVYGDVDAGGSTDAKVPGQGILRDAIDEMKQYNRISTPDRTVRFDSPNSAPYDVLALGGKAVRAGVDGRYPAGRFQVTKYASNDPTPLNLFSFVWVTDMPHGGDPRQAQLEWDYFKHWRRNADGTLTYSAK